MACLGLLLGFAAFYARSHIFNEQRFVNDAESSLNNSDVQQAAAAQLTEQLVAQQPDLVAAKPLIQAAAQSLIGTPAFQGLFGSAVRAAHQTVLDKNHDDAVVFIENLGVLIKQGLQHFDPALAKRLPGGTDANLVSLEDAPFAVDAAQIADKVSLVGLLLPVLALALLSASVALAPDRRRGVTHAGIAVGIAGLLGVILMFAGKSLVQGAIQDQADSRAAAGIWDAFLGSLRTWYFLLAGFGLIVATTAASLLRPVELDDPIRAVWRRLAHQPETTGRKLLWSAGLALAGLVMVLRPDLVLQLAVVVIGAYLISRALSAVIEVASPASAEDGTSGAHAARLSLKRAGLVLAVGGIGVLAYALLHDSGGSEPAVGKITGVCNGSAKLCDRELDKVVYPSTHNSYAGADYPGYVFPEQQGTIPNQLKGGVRGLWIDTYYGIPGRRVYTDTDLIDPALNTMLQQSLGPKFTQAAANIRATVAKPPAGSTPRIYLCHGYCELGAVDAGQTFSEIADFLAKNRNEVLLIDLEDYTTPEDTADLLEESELADYIYKGPNGPPWPTLKEMIEKNERVLLFAEHETDGAPDWYRSFEGIWQETLFQFKKPSQMSCAPNRGSPKNSLLLLNHWIDTDPAPKPTNAEQVNAYDFLLDRARKCSKKRGLLTNALNVDFWASGDVFKVAGTLNEQGR